MFSAIGELRIRLERKRLGCCAEKELQAGTLALQSEGYASQVIIACWRAAPSRIEFADRDRLSLTD